LKQINEITIYDLAKALRLSPSTVSRALNSSPLIRKETMEKVKSVAHEMGYRHNKFASNLRRRRSNTIGVVVPRLDSYFMAMVISGIERVTSLNGYGLIISQSQENSDKEKAAVNTLFNSRVDGLLVSLACDTCDTDHFSQVLDRQIPVVFFDRVNGCSGCINVVIDNLIAARDVTNHLIAQGCRRIAHIGGNVNRNVYDERWKGYQMALSENGIAYNDELVFFTDMKSKSGTEVAQRLMKIRPVPDAVFAANDTTAVAAILEFKKNGFSVPGDIAVAGFNNEPLCSIIDPNLTTVEYPAMEMGEIAASSLIDRINGHNIDDNLKIVLNHSVVIRQSSLAGRE